ncbi:Hypothetical predicted protein [Pelobates cultripes]|uniref:Uncharacterized protein n=1 Tax=Pelobates cultripes TaxID=61616 RepID=A0AAD1R4S9_PELCU|nr:Hypothetical predicted protein [Pelobates cultripes]
MVDDSCLADTNRELTCKLGRLFAYFLEKLDRCLRQLVRQGRSAHPPQRSPSAPVEERTSERQQHGEAVAVHRTQRGCSPRGPARVVAQKMDTQWKLPIPLLGLNCHEAWTSHQWPLESWSIIDPRNRDCPITLKGIG